MKLPREAIETGILGLRERLTLEGIIHVAMFGSRARGDDRPDSDLDLLIDVVPERPFSVLDLVGVQQVIGDEIGIAVNVLMRRSLLPEFRQAIASDVVDIY